MKQEELEKKYEDQIKMMKDISKFIARVFALIFCALVQLINS